MTLVGVALASACYAPEVSDCALRCHSSRDCAADQVCGADHLCAAPAIAGTCATAPDGDRPDGGSASDGTSDTSGASTTGIVIIELAGHGAVALEDAGTCDYMTPQHTCELEVALGTPVVATAIAESGWHFDKWTDGACADAPTPTCTFEPALVSEVGVKFRKGDAD